MPSVTSVLRGFGCSLTGPEVTRPGRLREDGPVSEYVAPPGYDVVAPDWDRDLRRPVLLRCHRCAALLLGGADTARHDAWHESLLPAPRISPA
jgi:hypothetical protein